MLLDISALHWMAAKTYFFWSNANKFTPSHSCDYYFIRTNQGEIYALAKKRERAKHLLGTGTFAKVVTIQDENRNLFACRIFDPDVIVEQDESIPVMKHLGVLKGEMTRDKKTAKTITIENATTKQKTQIKVTKKGYQVLLLAPGRSFDEVYNEILKRNEWFSDFQIDLIALKLCLALLAYHQKNVIHGDIKPENIHLVLLNDDVIITLVDQGFSMLLKPGETQRTLKVARGTPEHSAPEVWDSSLYSFKSDIFALGRIFEYLQRQEWQQLVIRPLAERASLEELIYHIWLKFKSHARFSVSVYEKMRDEVKAPLQRFYAPFFKEGTYLSPLLKQGLLRMLLTKAEIQVIAFYMAEVYYKNRDKTHPVVFADNAFIVKKENQNISLSTEDNLSHAIFPPELNNLVLKDQAAVYILGKLFATMGINLSQDATAADPTKRPSILDLAKELYLQACPHMTQVERDKCKEFEPEPFKAEEFLKLFRMALRPATPTPPADLSQRLSALKISND